MFTKFISKNIQQKLKAKERALARLTKSSQSQNVDGELSINDIASRTVFARMCSNKSKVPNILISGGEHNERGIPLGFGDTYKDRTGQLGSSGIRGVPGIKDISVEYKGGFKAIRECTVNWTIPAIEDLDRLTPYFLTVGKTVVIDWGWTYANKKTLSEQGISPFILRELDVENNTVSYNIDQEIFSNPQERILNSGGDYDAIGGRIKNFSYNLREDGGFDCTTIITAMGSALFHKPIDITGNTYGTRKLKKDDTPKFTPPDSLINSILNLKEIMYYNVLGLRRSKGMLKRYTDAHFCKKLLKSESHKVWAASENKYPVEGSMTEIFGIAVDDKKNPNVLVLYNGNDKPKPKIMVTWGWFEDQLLNRYLSFRGGSEDGKGIKMTMRSIDTIVDDDGLPIKSSDFVDDVLDFSEEETLKRYNITDGLSEYNDVLKSPTLIRNPPILLGTKPLSFHVMDVSSMAGASTSVKDIKKSDWKLGVQTIFSFGKNKKITTAAQDFYENFFSLPADRYDTNFLSKLFTQPGKRQKGRLRNVWMNIEEIQKAFGVTDPNSPDSTSENVNPPGTIEVAVRNLLNSLNSNFHNVWSFELSVDTYDSTNIKIIDKADTENEFPKYTKYADDDNSHEVQDLGLFQFPSYKIGSIVKNQTLEFKIPDAQSLTIMYGSNKKKGESDNQFSNGQLDKLFRMDTGSAQTDTYADRYLEDLETSNFKAESEGEDFIVRQTDVGSEGTDVNSKIIDGGSFLIDAGTKLYKWKKYEPDVQKPGTVKTSKDSIERYQVRKNKLGIPVVQYIKVDLDVEGKELSETQTTEGKGYYKIDDETNELLLEESAASVIYQHINSSSPMAQFDMNSLIPTELNLEIDGTGGILPGDIIHTEYIQHKYKANIKQTFNEPELTQEIGPLAYFQLFGITQKIDASSWTTELTSKMRINRFDSNALLEYTVPEDSPTRAKSSNFQPIPELQYNHPPPLPDDEDIADDVELDELEFDEFEEWTAPPIPSTVKLNLAKQEIEKTPDVEPEPEPQPEPAADDDDESGFRNWHLGPNYGAISVTDNDKEPVEPSPDIPVEPSAELANKEEDKIKTEQERIEKQTIIYVQPKQQVDLREYGVVEQIKGNTVDDIASNPILLADLLNVKQWESPEVATIEVNDNIEKEKLSETIVVDVAGVSREEIVILKSTYNPSVKWDINPNFKLIYKIVPGWYTKSKNNPKNTSFYGESPTAAVAKKFRQKFWDEVIEMPNETGKTALDTATAIQAKLDELGDTYYNLGPYDTWTPITGLDHARWNPETGDADYTDNGIKIVLPTGT